MPFENVPLGPRIFAAITTESSFLVSDLTLHHFYTHIPLTSRFVLHRWPLCTKILLISNARGFSEEAGSSTMRAVSLHKQSWLVLCCIYCCLRCHSKHCSRDANGKTETYGSAGWNTVLSISLRRLLIEYQGVWCIIFYFFWIHIYS